MEGAQALAIPTRFGQRMSIKQTKKSDLVWYSYDNNDQEWFKAQISLMDFSSVKTTDEEKSRYLQKLLKGAVRLNSEFLSKWNGFDVKTYLEFPNDWGLGSSSSLTYLVAQWADVNPLLLHFKISEGSGYDVACAGADSPINYKIEDDTINYTEIDFDPSFKNKLYFVHLNEKVSSKEAVEYYFKNVKSRKTLVKTISDLAGQMMQCSSFKAFSEMVDEHEAVMSEALKLPTVKSKYFSDFEGSIKSLGAWGGDFAMVCASQDESLVQTYFKEKGFHTVMPYHEMIFSSKEEASLSEV